MRKNLTAPPKQQKRRGPVVPDFHGATMHRPADAITVSDEDAEDLGNNCLDYKPDLPRCASINVSNVDGETARMVSRPLFYPRERDRFESSASPAMSIPEMEK